MANAHAALYLRSSKDRADVSIAAQRRELEQLASDRGMTITATFEDVVESAKSEHRPAFQDLLRAIKSADRTWSTLLLLDTSRLSRRRYVAQAFKHECRKRGIQIVYARVPETDPVSAVILESVFEAMDEVHSLLSREKGLAGMRENVSSGWRAGGRAPRGYQLERIRTGAMRDGAPVTKSILQPNKEAPLVRRYLQQRAAGIPRSQAARELGIEWSASTLVGLEWNALTYAGHTVWNRHSETMPEGGYKGGRKMRPREEWVIQRDTHEALITEEEAEAILRERENSDLAKAVSAGKRGVSGHMLSGLLTAPDVRQWEGWRNRYRLPKRDDNPGRYLPKEEIEESVVQQVAADFRSQAFVDRVLVAAHSVQEKGNDPAADLRSEVTRLNDQISRAMDLAMSLDDPAPATRKVNELEAQRKQLTEEIARIDRERQAEQALRSLSRDQVEGMIRNVADEIEGADRSRLKGVLQSAIEEIVLDPQTLECRIHYRIPVADTLEMASPRRRGNYGAALRADSLARICSS